MAGDRSTHHRTRVISRSLAVLLAGWWLAALPQTASAQLGGRAVPPPTYFLTMQNAYDRGDYASALRGFQDEWQGGIKNGAVRWVDSICFHTMLGECYYQEGDHSRALEQYNAACNLWIAHSTWMMNVQWPAAPRAANGNVNVAPWGTSNRRPQYAVYNDTYSVKQGNIDNSNVARNGGVVQLAVMFPVNVIEVCRCTALSARRRREILGPLVTFDTLAGDLVARLSGPSTPPGNWSQCFVDVMLGCSLAAAGKDQAAKTALERGLVAAGTFDHPLTGTALFELGRIELTAGNFLGAAGRFEEATYAAFQSNDVHLLEESFRYFALAHIMNGKPGNFGAAIAQAMTWAKARRAEPLYASLATLSAEALTVAGDARGATSAIGAAASAMGRNALASGKAGARMNFIAAQIFYQQGDVNNGDASLARAMAFQAGGSLWIFQMVLADEWFKKGVISPREAFDVYRTVLREPTPADWLSSPMESITTLLTPHPGPLENWFHVALGRKENEAAIDISDLIRRHRFFNSQAIGGRLLSLRWVLDGPEASLPQAVKLQRQDILAAFPAYDAAKKEAEALRAKIEAQPLLTADGEVQQQQAKLLEQYTIATARQEAVLKEISLRRTPCEMVFPPRRKIEDVQKSLGPKTACLAYIMAANRLYSCIITQKDLNITEITRATGGRGSVFTNVETLLKDWGNINAQRQIPAQTLAQERWKAIADDLSQQLLRTARTDFPAGYDELVVVPEGPLWYLPFEVLGSGGAESAPLITKLRVRYAPTVGLIVPDGRQRRPLPSTLLAVGKIYAQDKTGITDAAAEEFLNEVSMTLPVTVKTPLPAIPSIFTSFMDRLVVYDDVATGPTGPFSWGPLPWARGTTGGDMTALLNLPWIGPTQVILPGFHSAAEGPLNGAFGNDLFLASCGLMASGAETVVLSRWRTGGQTSFDIVREFVRELDHTSPADAWQRSVLLSMSGEIDLAKEPRIQAGANSEPPAATHPFFWASGMLFDSGDPIPGQSAPAEAGALAKLKEKQRLLEEAQKRQKEQQNAPDAAAKPDDAANSDAPMNGGKPERKPRAPRKAGADKAEANAAP